MKADWPYREIGQKMANATVLYTVLVSFVTHLKDTTIGTVRGKI